MAVTRQQIRLAGCGVVAALSLVVLLFYRPSAWAGYVAWTVSRIGGPLFVLCIGVFGVGVVLVLFSRYRRKPELLAAALALSAALHLLLVATLTFWVIGDEERPQGVREVLLELAPGLPSSIEDMIARQMREDLLEPLVRDEKSMETDKTSPSEADVPAEVPSVSAPVPDAPDRAPEALEPVKTAATATRRVDVGEAPAVTVRTEVGADMEQIVKLRPVETAAEAESAVPVETRRFETGRAAVEPVSVSDPADGATAPDLPVPDRAVRLETPDIRRDLTGPAPRPEQVSAPVEIALEVLELDMGVVPQPSPAVVEDAARMEDGRRVELEVAALERMAAAEAPLRAVMAPETPVKTQPAAPQAMPQELPDAPRRERPDDPRDAADPVARAMAADVAPLVSRVVKAEPGQVAREDTRPPVPSPAFALVAPRTASAPAALADAPLRVEQPELVAGATAAPGASLAPGRVVPAARRGAEVPRMMESAAADAPPRAEEQPADAVRSQMALLRTLASPSGDTGLTTNAVQRELAAGRASVEAFPERESSRNPAPGTASMRASVRPPAEEKTLVDAQARVAFRDSPHRAAAEADAVAGVRTVQDEAGVVAGIPVRQSTVAVAASSRDETGAAPRVPVPLADAGLPRSTAGASTLAPVPVRPDAPLLPMQQTEPGTDSIAGAALPGGSTGRSAPASPEVRASAAAVPMAGDMAQVVPVAGQVQALQVAPGDALPVETSSSRSGTAPAGALAAARAVQGDAVILEMATASRPAVQAPVALARTGNASPQALPQELPETQRRDRPGDPRQAAGSAPGGMAVASAPRPDDGGVTGIPVRQSTMASAAPVAEGSEGGVPRVPGGAAVMQVSRAVAGAVAPAPAPGRPDAPLVQARSSVPADGSIAGAVVSSGVTGRSSPAQPEGGATGADVHEPADVTSAGLVAGRVQPVDVQRNGGLASVEESRGAKGPAAPETALALQRAAAGGGGELASGSGPAAGGARPAMTLSPAPYRGDGTLADTAAAGLAAGMAALRGPAGAAGAAGAAEPRQARRTEDGGMLALPVAAGVVERGAASERGTESGIQRRMAPVFDAVAKAKRDAQEDSPVFTAPQGGWKAPPLVTVDRGTSGVRLSPGSEALAVRRVEAGESRRPAPAEADAVQHRIADDAARTVAAGKKAIYELRSPEKRRLIEDLGGSPETEAAVEQALVWLAGAQSDDGRWDVAGFTGVELCGGGGDRTDGNVAVSGLSLLAYLGAGYTHTSGRHRETVRKGLDWLIEGQDRDGDLRRGGTMYDQAMATAAICESLSLTGDRRLVGPARLAAGFIMSAQTPEAAWRYEPRNDSDTSVLGWQILALKSAEIAGVEISPKHYAWSGMWLDQVRKGGGGLYAYKPGHGPTPVMTAEGWFCQLFMGEDVRRQGQQESIAYLLENLPEWNEKGRGTVHLYYWYYATLAMRLSDVAEFDIWNKSLKTALLAGHRRDGPAAGSWDPVCQLGPRGGRIYSTAMSVLCLEVYYRYLPFYRRGTAGR